MPEALPPRPDDPVAIRAMFVALAPDYDRLNVLFTFGLVTRWRRALIRAARVGPGDRVLDVCTGTGRVLRMLRPLVEPEGLAVGIDFTAAMLHRAEGNVALADALRLPFPAGRFDATVSAFALRDVADQGTYLAEMARVTRPGGRIALLDIGVPAPGPARWGFNTWFRGAVPRLAGIFGQRDPYRFLVSSVDYLPTPGELCGAMERAGMIGPRWRSLTLGAARVFWARAGRTVSE
ncbi:MAG: class I SAM-dependent methyltransferase [Actinomycetota bacterium]|nr:class I SAM-dependent methyltransferase [Actinomycetota bacterium]